MLLISIRIKMGNWQNEAMQMVDAKRIANAQCNVWLTSRLVDVGLRFPGVEGVVIERRKKWPEWSHAEPDADSGKYKRQRFCAYIAG